MREHRARLTRDAYALLVQVREHLSWKPKAGREELVALERDLTRFAAASQPREWTPREGIIP